MKRILFILLTVIMSVSAQDFGYEYARSSDFRAIAVSYAAQSFSAAGSNIAHDTSRISFSTALPSIELRQLGSRIAVGYQTYSDRTGAGKSSFTVSAESHSDLALGGSRSSKGPWFIPIVVNAHYVRAEAPTNAVKDFDIGSFGIGTGVKYQTYGRTLGLQAYVSGTLSYASEGFSTDYGTQTALTGDISVVFPEFLFEGVLVGYRYERQQWNMSNDMLDYRRWSHGAVVGIMF